MRWSWSGSSRLDAHQPHRAAALRARRSADRRRAGLKLAHNLFPQANATRIVASCYLQVPATLAVMASKPKHPKMTKTYAVAVRDGPDLLLVLTIQRKNGNVYTNIPRPNLPDANPHSSYHASGLVHAKTYNRQAIPRQRQKPDANFRGTKPVEHLVIAPNDARAINVPCRESDFDGVFQIAQKECASIKDGRLCVDLAEPSLDPPLPLPNSTVVCAGHSDDAFPSIIVRLVTIA